jgi:hypothetical protein
VGFLCILFCFLFFVVEFFGCCYILYDREIVYGFSILCCFVVFEVTLFLLDGSWCDLKPCAFSVTSLQYVKLLNSCQR